MAKLNPKKVVPYYLIIESANKLLYSAGLYYQDRYNDKTKKRKFVRKQIIYTICLTIWWFEKFVFAFIPKQNKTIQFLFADLGNMSVLNEFYNHGCDKLENLLL